MSNPYLHEVYVQQFITPSKILASIIFFVEQSRPQLKYLLVTPSPFGNVIESRLDVADVDADIDKDALIIGQSSGSWYEFRIRRY